MTRSLRRSAAACALAALAAAASPAWTHGPGKPHEPPEPPPGLVIPPGPTLPPAALEAAPGPMAAVATTGVRSLRQLVADATAVIVGRVARTETFDDDRLRVQHVAVERVLRGRLDAGDVGVVEMRGASRRPSWLADGETVVLLASPAPAMSYLKNQLGAGAFVVPTGGRDGVVAVGSDIELSAVEQAIADGVAAASLEGDAAVAARRRLAFAELAGPSPRLAADAIVELRQLPALSPLADDELATVARALRETRTPVPTRATLATLLAERGAREAISALVRAETDAPAMLDAILAARARLGAPATAAELAALRVSSDAGVRAAALRALATTADAAAVTDLGAAATTDPDTTVRAAAIDALGTTGRTDALPILSGTFASHERDLQQRSARAILAIGGPAADDALVALALRGDRTETRAYATIVLLAARGADSAAVRRLVAAKPGPEVLHVIEHGLEMGHRHAAE